MYDKVISPLFLNTVVSPHLGKSSVLQSDIINVSNGKKKDITEVSSAKAGKLEKAKKAIDMNAPKLPPKPGRC